MEKEFEHDSMQDSDSIVRYLDALSDGFRNGRLLFGTRGKKLIFKPRGLLQLGVKAKRKGQEIKLTIKIGWVEKKHDDKNENALPLEIKAGKKPSKS